MKKIINGRKYDTDTATTVGEHEENYVGDFDYVVETLYRKRNGEYFLHGYGHAASRYATSNGSGGWAAGERIVPLAYDAAREWAERCLTPDEYESEFGEVMEYDGGDVVLSVRISPAAKAALERAASQTGRAKGDIVSELLLSLR